MSVLTLEQAVQSVAKYWRAMGQEPARHLAEAYQRELGYDAQLLMVRAAQKVVDVQNRSKSTQDARNAVIGLHGALSGSDDTSNDSGADFTAGGGDFGGGGSDSSW